MGFALMSCRAAACLGWTWIGLPAVDLSILPLEVRTGSKAKKSSQCHVVGS